MVVLSYVLSCLYSAYGWETIRASLSLLHLPHLETFAARLLTRLFKHTHTHRHRQRNQIPNSFANLTGQLESTIGPMIFPLLLEANPSFEIGNQLLFIITTMASFTPILKPSARPAPNLLAPIWL